MFVTDYDGVYMILADPLVISVTVTFVVFGLGINV